ncbi:BlaI/MecI/CopY family transcriptional regulator [Schlesneria paludicola]|uniref:BlaI/MecI/CopY family transcriptional regulator n=1 Tax=Schlesneria paludicola TaxID=360056 RepID=UPI00029B43DE|nr:BlaI/MecI/CopY family transcriptional regulator [Schlesneria paludicola]
MASVPAKKPTELELEILKVLWRIGPATVRQVRDELATIRDLAYTTVMTMMSIMFGKGYLARTKDGRTYVYRSIYREEKASGSLLRDIVDRVFGGSTTAVMQHLIETSDLDDNELKQIRLLINRKARENTERR